MASYLSPDISNLKQIASFAQCYAIEGNPPRIRLFHEETLLKTHQAVETLLMDLMPTHGDHPDVKRVKQNLQCGSSKYPVYFAALDVLRAAFAKLPAGSWAIYSNAECVKRYVIWKGFDQQVNMKSFVQDAELNGLRATALQESLRVQIL